MLIRIASVLLAAAVIWRDREREIYIPILACCLLLALGYVVSRLAGNLIADRENARLLGILHVDLDPEAFLRAYEPAAMRAPGGSRQRRIMEGYLASGYAAAGKAEKALGLLAEPVDADDAALAGTRAAARVSCLLDEGRPAEAAGSMRALDEAIDRAEKPALRSNLASERELLYARLKIAEGRPADRVWLKERLEAAPYRLKRLEILHAMTEDALRQGRTEAAKACREKLQAEAGKTWYARYAKEISR